MPSLLSAFATQGCQKPQQVTMVGGGGSSLLAPGLVRNSVQHFTCMLPGLYSYGGKYSFYLTRSLQNKAKTEGLLCDHDIGNQILDKTA